MAQKNSKTIRATELARLAGVSYSKVDHWADKELLVFTREDGRTRIFEAQENLLRCRFIKVQQKKREGFSLQAIKSMIEMGQHRGRRR